MSLHNTLAFEIRTADDYDLAVAICPSLIEIPFEAVQGHFFGLTDGEAQFATIPPGAFNANGLVLLKGFQKPIDIIRVVNPTK